MAVSNIILVHGYSVRSLDTYAELPALLASDGYNQNSIYLSAFDSLNDDITCDDLAHALEQQVRQLLSQGLDLAHTAFVCHSTGAIITRRWMLNRFNQQLPLPKSLITMAGANHGSTLAQMGKTQVLYTYRALTGGTAVGEEILEDLDYGSLFLLKLNEEWLDAYNSSLPPSTMAFSMGGDDHSDLKLQLFWQTKEKGSDSTVRVSGANLNYRMLSINVNDAHPSLVIKSLPKPAPHLIIHGYSHTGKVGIIDSLKAKTDAPYVALKKALDVNDLDDYAALQLDWQRESELWSAKFSDDCNSTLVFSLQHNGGRRIEDSLVLIGDNSGSLTNVTGSIQDHQPIQNDTTASSLSFYLNYPKFMQLAPHNLHIQVNSGCDEVTYDAIEYSVPPSQAALIEPNEFTYLTMTLRRNPQSTYTLLTYRPDIDWKRTWPPLPPWSAS